MKTLFQLLASYGFQINDWDDGTIRIVVGEIVHYVDTAHRAIDESDSFIIEEVQKILEYLLEHGTPNDGLVENRESPDYGCRRWSDIIKTETAIQQAIKEKEIAAPSPLIIPWDTSMAPPPCAECLNNLFGLTSQEQVDEESQ